MAELIVALDVQTRAEAEAKVKLLGDSVDFYKIGLELFSAEGPDVVKAVKGFGKKPFYGVVRDGTWEHEFRDAAAEVVVKNLADGKCVQSH